MYIDIIKEATEDLLEEKFTSSGTLLYSPEDMGKDSEYSLDSYTGKIFYKESSYISYLDYFIARPFRFLSASIAYALKKDNQELMIHYLSTSHLLSHLVIKTISKSLCSCENYADATTNNSGGYFTRKMSTIVPLVAPSAILQEWTILEEITQHLVDSLNAQTCTIGRGERELYIEWFTLKLLSQVFEIEIDIRKVFSPNKNAFQRYQNILDTWDTSDLLEVDKMVYLLAELHLDDAQENWDEFDHMLTEEEYLLFPYEIIVLLSMRQYKNLDNPKTYSHPLLQTSLCKTLLNIKKTIVQEAEAQSDIYLFLKKLQERCPNVEIPEWLNGQTETKEPTTETPKGDNIIPDDFFLKG